jgi:hypothetical protein
LFTPLNTGGTNVICDILATLDVTSRGLLEMKSPNLRYRPGEAGSPCAFRGLARCRIR